MSPASAPVRSFVRWTLANGRLLWILALLLAIPATWRTVQLYAHLHSDFEELLPKQAPSVVALDELRARTPGLSHLGIVVDVGDPANLPAGERFIDELAARVRTYPPDMVAAVRLGTTEERTFLEQNAPLYVEHRRSRRPSGSASKRGATGRSRRETGNLVDEGAPPSLDFSDIEANYKERSASKMPVRPLLERRAAPDAHARRGGERGRGRGAGEAPLGARARRREGARRHGRVREGHAPGVRGDVATAVEETEALDDRPLGLVHLRAPRRGRGHRPLLPLVPQPVRAHSAAAAGHGLRLRDRVAAAAGRDACSTRTRRFSARSSSATASTSASCSSRATWRSGAGASRWRRPWRLPWAVQGPARWLPRSRRVRPTRRSPSRSSRASGSSGWWAASAWCCRGSSPSCSSRRWRSGSTRAGSGPWRRSRRASCPRWRRSRTASVCPSWPWPSCSRSAPRGRPARSTAASWRPTSRSCAAPTRGRAARATGARG